ncbi:hypothetical protein LINPERHAP2_LOCUS18720, partial [Linum perenne]
VGSRIPSRSWFLFSSRLTEFQKKTTSIGAQFEESVGGDGIHQGVRGEFDPEVDGGSEGEGQELQGSSVLDEGSLQEDEGDVELSTPPLRVLDVRSP